MRIRFKETFRFLAFFFITCKVFSQPVIQDKWDTLQANVTYTFPVNEAYYFYQIGSLNVNNKLFLYGDSNHVYNSGVASYVKVFDPIANTLNTINYTRTNYDLGVMCAAAKVTNTPNLSYAFFSPRLNYENASDELALYKYNSNTGAVTSETLSISNDQRYGVLGMCFFSPTSNHDSLILFNEYQSNGGQVEIYKKHYAQNGIVNYSLTLPNPIQQITKTFVFNNILYMGIYDGMNYDLLISSNGLTFNSSVNYTLTYPNKKIVGMDTLNGELYLNIYDVGQNQYNLIKTTNGNSFINVYPAMPSGEALGLINHKKRLWTIKKNPSLFLYQDRPIVNYVGGPLMDTEILSLDTVGRPYNQGSTFDLNKINNKLYLSGSFVDNLNEDYGTFIYRLREPVAAFTPTTQQICLNSPFTLLDNSLNADSVRWIKDNNFFAAGNQTTYVTSFNSVGQHTLGQIAITGTQRDTMKLVVNVYSVSLNISIPSSVCQNIQTNISAIVSNNQGATTYSWTVLPIVQTAGTNTLNASFTPTVPGTYSITFTATDAQNCVAGNSITTITVNSSKNISGVVTNSGTPVSGEVILFKHEPNLTKFDTVAKQITDGLGNFSFNGIDPSNYIVMCVPNATNLLVTYGNSAASWKNATLINHGCINTSTQNINVIGLTNIGTGPGILTGKIVEGEKYGQKGTVVVPGGPIKGISAKCGRNPGGDIVAQGRTTPSGGYTITELPENAAGESYFILVDIPGLDTNGTYHKIVMQGSTVYENLDFVVDSAKINPTVYVGLSEIKTKNGNLRIYPNPTNGEVNFEMDGIQSQELTVTIFDLMGKEVFNITPSTHNNKIVINLDALENGVYLIRTGFADESRTTRLIITK